MLQMTPQRARFLARNSRNPDTQAKMFAFLRDYQDQRRRLRAGEDLRPADYGRHKHTMHQYALGFSQCTGCSLRVKDEQVAA